MGKGFEDHERAGEPLTLSRRENSERINKVLNDDNRLSVKKVAHIAGMLDRIFHRVMSGHLEMRNIQGTWVPILPSEQQKKTRLEVSVLSYAQGKQDKFSAICEMETGKLNQSLS